MKEQYDRLIHSRKPFISGYEGSSPVASSDSKRLLSGCRLTQTAFLGDPYCCSKDAAGVRGFDACGPPLKVSICANTVVCKRRLYKYPPAKTMKTKSTQDAYENT